MITYITKDDTKIDKSTFAHFIIGDIHYVACFEVTTLDKVQRIPWSLFQSKMKHNKAIWVVPGSAAKAQVVFNANRDEFLRYISYFDTEEKQQEFISQSDTSRDRSLLDVESERVARNGARRWR